MKRVIKSDFYFIIQIDDHYSNLIKKLANNIVNILEHPRVLLEKKIEKTLASFFFGGNELF